MNIEKIKSFFLKVMIGCLIAAAAIAVVTVLAGHFNDVLEKALLTILLVAIHSLISFAFIMNNEKQETFESLNFFTNMTFFIIIMSFLTSILGLWDIFPGGLVGKLYELYFVLLFATLHGEVLAKIRNKQSSINGVIYSNYVFMSIVVLMLLPIIFVGSSGLDPFYFRLLAASAIIDGTLSLTAAILHKLYIQKHPEVKDPVFSAPQVVFQPGAHAATVPAGAPAAAVKPKKGLNIFVTILLVLLALQLLAGLILEVVGGLSH
jgi:hypothetical protein